MFSNHILAITFVSLFVIGLCHEPMDDFTLKTKMYKFGQAKVQKPDCMKASDSLGCACPVCKDVVYFTKMMIIDHAVDEQQVLDKVCSRIFGDDKTKKGFCESLVNEELPKMIDYVKNRMDPRKVCEKFC
ncbi:unnamed protein product [Auanema sp. JU1783]|nr:unnamed protein product [Auanema sp. JU1783]